MNILSVDTGSLGGLALLDPEGEPIAVRALPATKTGRYWTALIAFIESAGKCGEFEAVVEKVWGMPGQAGGSTIAKNFGIVLGILKTYGIEPIEVVPQTWQRPFIQPREKRDSKGETDNERKARLNQDREERKQELIAQAAGQYGRMVDHSGIADALLIGRWLWLVRQGRVEPPKSKPKRRGRKEKKNQRNIPPEISISESYGATRYGTEGE